MKKRETVHRFLPPYLVCLAVLVVPLEARGGVGLATTPRRAGLRRRPVREVLLHVLVMLQVKVVPKRDCKWVNNYNSLILTNLRGNMDIQFVPNPHGTAQYMCAAYCAKAEQPDEAVLSSKMMHMLAREHHNGIKR